jgi:hypothetical protein
MHRLPQSTETSSVDRNIDDRKMGDGSSFLVSLSLGKFSDRFLRHAIRLHGMQWINIRRDFVTFKTIEQAKNG